MCNIENTELVIVIVIEKTLKKLDNISELSSILRSEIIENEEM